MTTDLPLLRVDAPPVGGAPLGAAPARGHAAVAPTFEEIFAAEAAYVGRALRYLGVGQRHLEDACQEVFLVVHRRIGQLRGGSVRAWVRQICIHVAGNHRRSLQRRREDAVSEPPEVAAPAAQQGAVEQRQAMERLCAALDALPEEQRDAFVLYEIEDLTMSEVAEALGCPLQTAYSRLYAARAKVQEAMKDVAP